jgi:hypothetical protein
VRFARWTGARVGDVPKAILALSAGYHASILRHAGLVDTHRDGNTVHHTLTGLGANLRGQRAGASACIEVRRPVHDFNYGTIQPTQKVPNTPDQSVRKDHSHGLVWCAGQGPLIAGSTIVTLRILVPIGRWRVLSSSCLPMLRLTLRSRMFRFSIPFAPPNWWSSMWSMS